MKQKGNTLIILIALYIKEQIIFLDSYKFIQTLKGAKKKKIFQSLCLKYMGI